jgi:hypothetical protein
VPIFLTKISKILKMKYLSFSILLLLGTVISMSSCEDECVETAWYEDADGDGLGNPDVSEMACDQPTGYVADNTDTDDTGGSSSTGSTPTSAFDEFDTDNVTVTFNGSTITLESNGLTNHTSWYWSASHALHDANDPCMTSAMPTPNEIEASAMNYSLTLDAAPTLASSSTETGLGTIGMSITGAPIYNETEGTNQALDAQMATTLDCAGGHTGPTGYHYHVEARNGDMGVSHDDENLVGIMKDGFLLYGRKCNSTGAYPTDIDASGGHTSATQHSNGETFYHYHIVNEFLVSDFVALFAGDLQGNL